MRRTFALTINMLMAALLLCGCMLASGQRLSADALPESGNTARSFVSAEGGEEQTLATGLREQALAVIVIVKIGQGDLQIDLLDPDGSVALIAQGQPAEQLTWTGTVRTDSQGILRYRITARGAREGEYQILYRAER